jgi:hypothetical protein
LSVFWLTRAPSWPASVRFHNLPSLISAAVTSVSQMLARPAVSVG